MKNDTCDFGSVSGLEPTEALPGSPAKIEVLKMRASLGVPLWHDEDLQDLRISHPNASRRGPRGKRKVRGVLEKVGSWN
ncbi:MAG: hypothetical protein U0892_14770 [Pirellulales bacterium]